jgi:hypothetical protein
MFNLQADMVLVQIGGGNRIDNSQGQIEDNVIWLNRILKRTGNPVKNYFASGSGSEKDVALYVDKIQQGPMSTLSRVFDDPSAERIHYRHNKVPNLSGGMRKNQIQKSLRSILSNLSDEQEFLIIYNGHGDIDESDVRGNYLKIWDDERLTVSEVDSLFDAAPDTAVLRFVFPQCYSGGFYHLIYDNPHSDEFGVQTRCGFFAESAYEESEGCSLNTNREEYRDYSTYFFAPLNGKTRNNEDLPVDPDLNGDGVISFSESHIYAIKAGNSKDLSRSTSEVYLEEWLPWYLRWGGGRFDTQSRYWLIARYLANREELAFEDKYLGEVRRQIKDEIETLEADLKSCREEADALAGQIRDELIKAWPELLRPYTGSYKQLIESQAGDITNEIERRNDYGKLVEAQNRCADMGKSVLNKERRLVQVEKIVRYRKLAMIAYYFDRYASADEKARYNSLVKCEGGDFFRLDRISAEKLLAAEVSVSGY